MTDYDRFSDEYDPEPDYDRPTRAEALAEHLADESWASRFAEREQAQRDAWVRARYQETCEDRLYACCNFSPPGEDEDEGWYDRHLDAWLNHLGGAERPSEAPQEPEDGAEWTETLCPICGADIPPHAPDCPAGQAEQPDDVGEDF